MPANLDHETIAYRPLALRGAVAGAAAGVVIAAVAMALHASGDTDVWSFPKVAATIALGDDAARPLTGFEAAPVLVGLLVHLLVSTLLGMVFALVVGFAGLKEPAPLLLAGFVYGVVVFLFTYVLIANAFFPAFHDLNELAFFAVHPVFGVTAALFLHHWADRFDLGPAPDGDEVTWASPEATGFHVVVAAIGIFAAAVVLGVAGMEPRAITTVLVAVLVVATIAHLLHVHLPRPGRRIARSP